MRLLIVQYAGDYRAATRNFAAGQDETYYAQRYSVDAVAALQQWANEVTIICCTTQEVYDEVLPNGVRAIGAGFSHYNLKSELLKLLALHQPTHLITDLHDRPLLNWAKRNNISTLTLFASSLATRGLLRKLTNFLLVRALNFSHVAWVGSYGINSALQLSRLGVHPQKIIPWDFIIEPTPGTFPPKSLRTDDRPWTIFYAGSLVESKGVGDILKAVALLKERGVAIQARLVGNDAEGLYAARAKQLRIENNVEFLGVVVTKTIELLMHDADVVMIPSHHDYLEGFPMTIHHGLKSRTPIVLSDHPMFQNLLVHESNALIFPAGHVADMAECIDRLRQDAELYEHLSNVSHKTWNQFRLSVKWADILEHWLKDTMSDRQWLKEHSLSSELYSSHMATPEINGENDQKSSKYPRVAQSRGSTQTLDRVELK
jgi:glycosyltransferase involved in cell wall biosynthesis